MSDRPLLIPTSEGPLGAVVSEPVGSPRAAMAFLPGYGRPARSGINSFWTRLARELARRGVAVLRVDYSREGETLPIGKGVSGQTDKRRLDLLLLGQALAWFGARLDGMPIHLVGTCAGARAAIELAAAEPELTDRTFLLAPHIRALADAPPVSGTDRVPGRPEEGEQVADPEAVDPILVDCLRMILSCAPAWVLTGERDSPDLPGLQRLLGATEHELRIEVVPDVAIHFLDQPELQHEVRTRLLAEIEATLRVGYAVNA